MVKDTPVSPVVDTAYDQTNDTYLILMKKLQTFQYSNELFDVGNSIANYFETAGWQYPSIEAILDFKNYQKHVANKWTGSVNLKLAKKVFNLIVEINKLSGFTLWGDMGWANLGKDETGQMQVLDVGYPTTWKEPGGGWKLSSQPTRSWNVPIGKSK